MILTKYRVQNFKSVKDSGWIECTDVTTLVGVNEAGKTNLLRALWKLNPVSGGEIDILHDAPVSSLTKFRNIPDEIPFVSACFELEEADMEVVCHDLGFSITPIKCIEVTRYYDGLYSITYNDAYPEIIQSENSPVKDAAEEITQSSDEEGHEEPQILDEDALDKVILKHMPKFVYYSDYGNLSTKLYLPHVIKWLNNESVEGISTNHDQVRTIRVLFQFVELKPEEILGLGADPKDMAARRNNYSSRSPYQPTAEEIEKARKAKEERTILLQSAGSKLTKEFSDWWKQGNYKFRFEADGDYFTIWVSDSKRPAEVSLELRSTGLQWFISFFLVFLVESKFQHKDAILLLDEAGLTLHPKAQKDLSAFFNSLAKENQIIHTTHSPFIVDTNHIDRCKVVYVDADGYTVASANLRDNGDKLNEQSIYALHAALGLSVSDILLHGCKPVIVEGPSDQIYLSAIKLALIGAKKYTSKEEVLFLPSGGVKGINGIVSLLGGTQGKLPVVMVDSDKSGLDAKKKLISGLYQDDKNNIMSVGDFCDKENAEIEDLIPVEYLNKGINKLFSEVDDDEDAFEDFYDNSKAIIPQIQQFAENNKIVLPGGWKVELAKSAKARIARAKSIDADVLAMWSKLFDSIDSSEKR